MTELLEQAIEQLKELTAEKQDAIATLIIEEMADDLKWETMFASPQSQNLLASLAAEAMAEYRLGKTEELDPETL